MQSLAAFFSRGFETRRWVVVADEYTTSLYTAVCGLFNTHGLYTYKWSTWLGCHRSLMYYCSPCGAVPAVHTITYMPAVMSTDSIINVRVTCHLVWSL